MTVTNPELAMLVPYENHINPFAVYINNQHLKQQVEHRLKANLSFHLDSIPMNWWADGAFNYVHHGWGTRTAYDSSTGAFTYMDDNVNAASWNLLLRSGFDYRLDAKRRLTLVFSDYIDYVHSADFTVLIRFHSTCLANLMPNTAVQNSSVSSVSRYMIINMEPMSGTPFQGLRFLLLQI